MKKVQNVLQAVAHMGFPTSPVHSDFEEHHCSPIRTLEVRLPLTTRTATCRQAVTPHYQLCYLYESVCENHWYVCLYICTCACDREDRGDPVAWHMGKTKPKELRESNRSLMEKGQKSPGSKMNTAKNVGGCRMRTQSGCLTADSLCSPHFLCQ